MHLNLPFSPLTSNYAAILYTTMVLVLNINKNNNISKQKPFIHSKKANQCNLTLLQHRREEATGTEY